MIRMAGVDGRAQRLLPGGESGMFRRKYKKFQEFMRLFERKRTAGRLKNRTGLDFALDKNARRCGERPGGKVVGRRRKAKSSPGNERITGRKNLRCLYRTGIPLSRARKIGTGRTFLRSPGVYKCNQEVLSAGADANLHKNLGCFLWALERNGVEASEK